MAKRRKNKEIEFIMNTDWLFEDPIDQEHKEFIPIRNLTQLTMNYWLKI